MDAGMIAMVVGALSLLTLIILYGILGWKSKIYRLIIIIFILGIATVWIYPTFEWYILMDEKTRDLVNIPQTAEENIEIEGATLKSINSYTKQIRSSVYEMRKILNENKKLYRYPEITVPEDESKKPAILDIRVQNKFGATLNINSYKFKIDRETFISKVLPKSKINKEDYENAADKFFEEIEQAERLRSELDKIFELKELKKQTITLGLDLAGGISFTLDIDEENLRKEVYTQYSHLLDEEKIRENEDMKQYIEEVKKSFIGEIKSAFTTEERIEIEQKILNETEFTSKELDGFKIEFAKRLGEKAQSILETQRYKDKLEAKISEQAKIMKSENEQQMTDYINNLKEQTKKDALDILKKRVNQFGVSEPEIGKTLGDRPLVQLAGADDPVSARKIVTEAGKLEFRIVNGELMGKISGRSYGLSRERLLTPTETAEELYFILNKNNPDIPFEYIIESDKVVVKSESGNPEEDSYAYQQAYVDNYGERRIEGWMFLKNKVEMEGKHVINPRVTMGGGQGPSTPTILFDLDDEGSAIFPEVTGNNIKKQLAIVLDGYIKSAPTIDSRITGSPSITGIDNVKEAQNLVSILKAGSISSKLKIVSENIIGPKLGAENINNGIKATLIGFGLVILFMFAYYRVGGLFANIALILNLFLLVSILSLMHFTLTLPGIAGILLTIGMAVDANVLIFERIKEEIRNGKSIVAAVDEGYGKALWTIFDANITTILAAIVLSQVGTGVLKGFGVTLAVGIACSMFTALVVSKLLIDVLISIIKGKKLWI